MCKIFRKKIKNVQKFSKKTCKNFPSGVKKRLILKGADRSRGYPLKIVPGGTSQEVGLQTLRGVMGRPTGPQGVKG